MPITTWRCFLPPEEVSGGGGSFLRGAAAQSGQHRYPQQPGDGPRPPEEYAEAEAHFAEATLDPGSQAHFNLGLVHATGEVQGGGGSLRGGHTAPAWQRRAHLNLGNVLSRLGNYEAAKAHYADAIRLDPGCAEAYNASAMIMAACPEAKFRDGKGAVAFATRACELTKWKDPRFLNTLAAAQAEMGDFDAAVTSQKKAIELLTDQRQQDDYRSRLVLYQAKKPYRQISPSAPVRSELMIMESC